jgi:hypothetical protein
MPSLAITFYVGAAISVISAVLCAKRGETYVYEIHGPGAEESGRETGPQQVSGERVK